MNNEQKEAIQKWLAAMPRSWTEAEKQNEAARYCIEEGWADLPDVEAPGFDRAVEDAYEFFRGEIVHMVNSL